MSDNTFLEKLANKYNYNNKLVNALNKIIPCLIEYYGIENKYTILEALLNTEIITCSSTSTIQNIIKERKLISVGNGDIFNNIDLKRNESIYFPNFEIIYNSEKNIYEINKLERLIITGHLFNYDSPKGLEVLTHALCHLIKSYKDEITIFENNLIIKNGIAQTKNKIIYGETSSLELIEKQGQGLEEGFNIYDTEKIVSLILKDAYKCYDYDSVYLIAKVLKEKYGFSTDINNCQINGNINKFKKMYGEEVSIELCNICDELLNLENEMLLAFTREDKNKLSDILNKKLNQEAFHQLMEMYKSDKQRRQVV